MIENNLPLAINRAKLFYRKTPKTHLTLMDFINICTHGLISGIDKYHFKEYSKVWRSVCIGRMVGYMIEEYSKTSLRMYPIDRKVLYRINSIRAKTKTEDMSELLEAVNQSFLLDKKEGRFTPKLPITEQYMTTLLNGSNFTSTTVHTDTGSSGMNSGIYDTYDQTADENADIENNYIGLDLQQKLSAAILELPILAQKLIKLRGVSL